MDGALLHFECFLPTISSSRRRSMWVGWVGARRLPCVQLSAECAPVCPVQNTEAPATTGASLFTCLDLQMFSNASLVITVMEATCNMDKRCCPLHNHVDRGTVLCLVGHQVGTLLDSTCDASIPTHTRAWTLVAPYFLQTRCHLSREMANQNSLGTQLGR